MWLLSPRRGILQCCRNCSPDAVPVFMSLWVSRLSDWWGFGPLAPQCVCLPPLWSCSCCELKLMTLAKATKMLIQPWSCSRESVVQRSRVCPETGRLWVQPPAGSYQRLKGGPIVSLLYISGSDVHWFLIADDSVPSVMWKSLGLWLSCY